MISEFANLRVNSERLRRNFDELSQIGATVGGGVSRLALSNEDLEARAWFGNQLDMAGLVIGDDDAGNLSGILISQHPEANKTILIGSHLDSVPNGGRYDSSIGLLAGLEVLHTIRESGLTLPVHLEVIDFTDEEGCWHSLFGSKSLTGKLDASAFRDSNDDHDLGAFRAALFRAGIRPNDVYKAARNPETLAGYLELHIEQGNRLYQTNNSIGIVSGIVGRSTYEFQFLGEASHSGTTDNAMRRDALRGAADFITHAHDMVHDLDNGAIFNCGQVHVEPGAFNVIPSKARLIAECRHPDEDILMQVEEQLVNLAEEMATKHRIGVKSRRLVHMPAAKMSPLVISSIAAATRHLGIENVLHLTSFAGHDAQMLSSFTPTGMIFIPSVKGISHNPKEFTNWEDIVNGVNVLLHSTIELAVRSQQISNTHNGNHHG